MDNKFSVDNITGWELNKNTAISRW